MQHLNCKKLVSTATIAITKTDAKKYLQDMYRMHRTTLLISVDLNCANI